MSWLTPALATLLSAFLSVCGALVVCVINNRAQNAERSKAEAVRDAKLEMWMQSVDRKLDVHNGYAERFSEIQTDIAVIKNDIKTLYRKGE